VEGIFPAGSKESAAPETSTQPPPAAVDGAQTAGNGSPHPEPPLRERQKAADSREAKEEALSAPTRQAGQETARTEQMQQQIQHLSEQVVLLEEALRQKTVTAPPRPATPPVAAKTEEDAPPVSSGEKSTRMQPSLAAATTEPTILSALGVQSTMDYARFRYRASTAQLVAVANELHASMPIRGASIVAIIRRRLTAIGRDALEHGDPKVIQELMAYRRWRFLNIAMRDSEDVKRAKKTYRDSALALVRALSLLDEMASQAAVDLAAAIHDRLAMTIHEATSENDVQMLRALLSTKKFRWHFTSDNIRTLTPAQPVRKNTERIPTSTPVKIVRNVPEKIPTPIPVKLVRRVPLETHRDKRKASEVIVSPEVRADNDPASLHNPLSNPTQEVKAGEVCAPLSADALKYSPAHIKKTYVESVEFKAPAEDDGHIPSPQSNAQSPSNTIRERQGTDASTKSSNQKPTQAPRTSFANSDSTPAKPVSMQSGGGNGHSLFEELFPEAVVSPPVRPAEVREPLQRLDLPEPGNRIRLKPTSLPKTPKDQIVQSFVKRGEDITVLQLEHCSTELTEFDFRRLIAKGKHIEAWNSDGAFYKVIPGRDPLSLERLPFYYLLFRSPESAHAYQKNAGRLHKLTALHQPSNIFSAIPPPKGFLEDGEDIEALTSSYVLRPTGHSFSLRTVMQPYHPALSALFKQGGYIPIVPNTDGKRNRIHKVLMHIEGYEPSLSDLFKILRKDAYNKGMSLTLRNESASSIHRLRDLLNLKTNLSPIATTNPRAYDQRGISGNTKLEFEDPNIAHLMKSDASGEGENPQEINQIVMNRVYNRWILEFDDEDEAKRFVVAWHRRPLPNLGPGGLAWKEYEEMRICNCELLW
jgi:hypothetical protein